MLERNLPEFIFPLPITLCMSRQSKNKELGTKSGGVVERPLASGTQEELCEIVVARAWRLSLHALLAPVLTGRRLVP